MNMTVESKEGLVFLDDLSYGLRSHRYERGPSPLIDRPESCIEFGSHVDS